MFFVIFVLVLLGGGGNLSKTKGEKGEDFYAIQNFHRLSSVILIMSSLFRLI